MSVETIRAAGRTKLVDCNYHDSGGRPCAGALGTLTFVRGPHQQKPTFFHMSAR